MPRIANHIRSNLVAYLALFVALGGTSYAALSLPAGSVGTRQLKHDAVTPAKLDRTLIGGSVRAWAYVSAAGHRIAGSGVRDVRRQESTPASPDLYTMVLADRHVLGCAATASVVADPRVAASFEPGSAVALVTIPRNKSFPVGVGVQTYDAAGDSTALPFLVEVLC
jgi:hypothetical protein